MKALKSLIILTSVLFLYDSALAQATTSIALSGESAVCADKKDKNFTYCMNGVINRERQNKCQEVFTKMREAEKKAKQACQDANLEVKNEEGIGALEKCLEKSQQCASILTAEVETDLGQDNQMLALFARTMGMPNLDLGGGNTEFDEETIKGQCYAKKDFDQEVKDIKRELSDVEDDIAKIQKDIANAKDDAAKEQEESNKAYADLVEQSRKEDLENAENERSQAADLMKAQAEAKAQVSNLNVEILQVQAQLASAINDRTQRLLEYTDSMIKRKCLDQIDKTRSQNAPLRTGSQTGVIQQNSTRKKNEVQDFNNCIRSMISAREATRQASQSQIDGLNATIDQKMTQSRDVQSSLSMASSQQQARAAEQAAAKQQMQVERNYRAQNLKTAQQTKATTTSQRIMELNQQLTEADKKKNNASARLALLGTKPAGMLSPIEAGKAYSEFETELSTCDDICGADACKDKTLTNIKGLLPTSEAEETGAAASSTSTPPTRPAGAAGTDGK